MATASQLLPFPPGSCFNICETETHIVALFLGNSLAQSRQNFGTNVPGWEEHRDIAWPRGSLQSRECACPKLLCKWCGPSSNQSYVERNDTRGCGDAWCIKCLLSCVGPECGSQNLHRKVDVVMPVTPGQGGETGEPMGLAGE